MKKRLQVTSRELQVNKGFTIVELLVSMSIFATTITMMLVLLNYTLKIQRNTEALRQASQGMRNLVEFLVKEIRNGKIDYGISGGTTAQHTQAPCPNSDQATIVVGNNTFGQSAYSTVEGGLAESRLPLINLANEQECIFWGKDDGSGGTIPATLTDVTNGFLGHLAISKLGVTGYERLTPANMQISYLRFYIRPLCDPYASTCNEPDALPEVQPFVSIIIRFKIVVGDETVIIPYQTTVTTDDYAIPRT